MNNKILIIIVNYNSETIYKSIKNINDSTSNTADIVVVDSYSEIYPFRNHDKIYINKLIELENNNGFGFSVNEGIRYGINNKYKVLGLIGHDVYVSSEAILNMYGYLINSNSLLVSGITLYDDNNYQCYGGGYINQYTGIGGNIKSITDSENCDYPNLSLCLFYSDLVEKIGYFDENIFIYWEDADFGFSLNNFLADSFCYGFDSGK